MTLVSKYAPPQLTYGVHENFFDSQSFSLPADASGGVKDYILTPQQNRDDAKHIAAGCTAIRYNEGLDFTGVPAGRRAVFVSNQAPIESYCVANGIDNVNKLSEAQCQQAIANFYLQRGGVVIDHVVSGITEYQAGKQQYAPLPNLAQYNYVQKALATRNPSGKYYGEYDGHWNPTYATSDFAGTQPLEGPMTNPQQALSFLQQYPGIAGNNYFSGNAWQDRHGMVNVYWNHEFDAFRKTVKDIVGAVVTRQAAIAAGQVAINRRLLAFGWEGEGQILNNGAALTQYQVPVAGGYTTKNAFFHYSVPLQAARLFLFLLDGHYNGWFGWNDTYRKGYVNTILNNDPAVVYTGSGSVTYTGPQTTYDPTNTKAYYPDGPNSASNGTPIGAQMYSQACAWAGTTNWSWVRSRPSISGSSYCDNDALYLLKRERDRVPLAVRIGGTSSKCALLVFPDGAGSFTTRDYDIGASSPVTVECAGLRPSLYFIN